MMRFPTVVALVLFCCGCQTTNVWTPNMRNSAARSAGDMAMTAVLDQGVDKAEAESFCKAMIKWLESGTFTKLVFREKCYDLLEKHDRLKYVDYLDALFALIPSQVGYHDQIPPDIKEALISFLKDGALHSSALYKPQELPEPWP